MRLLILTCAIVVVGCGSIEDAKSPSQLPLWARMESGSGPLIRADIGEPYGLIFGTLGTSGNDEDIVNRRVIVRLKGGGYGSDVRASYTRMNLDKLIGTPSEVTYQLLPGAAPAQATAFVFRVKPGDYELQVLQVSGGSDRTPMVRAEAFSGPIAEFAVAEGHATYLGELLSTVSVERGAPQGAIVHFLVNDQVARDYKFLLRRDPTIPRDRVVNISAQLAKSRHPMIRKPE